MTSRSGVNFNLSKSEEEGSHRAGGDGHISSAAELSLSTLELSSCSLLFLLLLLLLSKHSLSLLIGGGGGRSHIGTRASVLFSLPLGPFFVLFLHTFASSILIPPPPSLSSISKLCEMIPIRLSTIR
jgi:hypothetical protein